MQPKVQGALYEWLAGVIIGAIPLLAHLVAYFSTAPIIGREADWTGDLIFIVVATSGTSMVSVANRLLSGDLDVLSLSKSALTMIAVTVVFLVLAATLYGSVAVGHARSFALLEALGLLVGSLLTSIYLELTLASKLKG